MQHSEKIADERHQFLTIRTEEIGSGLLEKSNRLMQMHQILTQNTKQHRNLPPEKSDDRCSNLIA